MGKLASKVMARFKEPSTMAGVSVLMGLIGVPNAPEVLHGVGTILAGCFGLLAVFMPEKNDA